MKSNVCSYSYSRNEVKAGILHIGVGNFHRAHEEFLPTSCLKTPPNAIGASVALCSYRSMNASSRL